MNIKNIIFDFGGVIIEIKYENTRSAFIDFGLKDFDNHFSQFRQNPVFDKWDVGKIKEDEFFTAIEKMLPKPVERELTINAWNAMLGDFPRENYELLLQMKNRYRTFLFSNTNETHLDFYFRKLHDWFGIDNMDPLFEKTYYSCRLGLRKPDVEGFHHIIKENNLNPAETLFIDDSIQHVEGARKTGLRAFHLQNPMTLTEALIFNGLLP